MNAHRTRPANADRAFTIVELMVVLMVVSILLGIVIPNFVGARDRSNDSVAQTNLTRARLAASRVFSADRAYDRASATGLAAVERTLSFVDGSVASASSEQLSVQATSAEWWATVRSQSGSCYWVRAGVDGHAMTGKGDGRTCSASSFSSGTSSTVLNTPGLVGYWRLGESSGTTATDSSGNGRNGTYTASGVTYGQLPATVDGATSATLDGTSGYVTLPAMNPTWAAGVTISAWIRPTNTGSFQRILDIGNGAAMETIALARNGTASGLAYGVYNGGVGGNTATAAGVLTQNTWQHVAVTHAPNGTVTFYRNGSVVGTQTGYTYFPVDANRTTNYIGKSNWPDPLWQGGLQDVALFNRALSASEVGALYTSAMPPSRTSLALWLDGKDIDGDGTQEATTEDCAASTACTTASNLVSRWVDKSGNGNNGTAATTLRPTYVPASGLVSFVTDDVLTLTSSISAATVIAVYRLDSLSGPSADEPLVGRVAGSGSQDALLAGTSATWSGAAYGFLWDAVSSSKSVPYTQEPIGSLQVMSGVNGQLWLNGGPMSTADATRGATSAGVPVVIDSVGGAKRSGSTAALDGKLAELLVWTTALTTDQRQQVERYLAAKWSLTLSGTGVTAASQVPVTSGLEAWYDAEDIDADGVAEGASESGLSAGTLVGTWRDRSTLQRNVTGTGAQMPTVVSSGQNGRPVVRFDGSTDVLTSAAGTTVSAAGQTMFVVTKINGSMTSPASPVSFAASGTQACRGIIAKIGQIFGVDGCGVTSSSVSTLATSWGSYSVQYTQAAVTGSNLWVNGSLAAPGTGTDPVLSWNTVQLGARDTSLSRYYNGDLAETLVYSRVLTSSERQQVEAYLRAKWATP